jgi:uroporphyrinogen decarboxylase
MSRKERLLTAMNCEEPDTVPVAPRFGWYTDAYYGTHSWMTHLRAGKDFDFDPLIIVGPYTPAFRYTWYPWGPFDYEGVEVKLEVRWAGSDRIVTRAIQTPEGPLSDKTIVYGSRAVDILRPYYTPDPKKLEYLVKTPEDLKRVRYLIPDPSYKYPDLREIINFVGGDGLVEVACYGPLDHVFVCSLETLLASPYRDRKFFTDLLQMIQEHVLAETEAYLRSGAEAIFAPWYFCSMSAGWSPKTYREFFVSLIRQQVDLVHKYGAIYDFYDDGKCMDVISMLKECGVDVLQTLTPPPYGDFDLARAKEEIGDAVCLSGYIDAPNVIRNEKPNTIEKEVKRAIEIAAPGGGFILGACDDIARETPIENVRAYFSAGRKYGKY